jgi:hypothetical protein
MLNHEVLLTNYYLKSVIGLPDLVEENIPSFIQPFLKDGFSTTFLSGTPYYFSNVALFDINVYV